MIMETLYPIITGLLAGGGGAAAVGYAAMKFGGAKYVDMKVQQGMERMRHGHALQVEGERAGAAVNLEAVRAQHLADVDRRIKRSAREIESLSAIWDKLAKAYDSAQQAVRKVDLELDCIPRDAWEAMLQPFGLDAFELDRIRNGKDPQSAFEYAWGRKKTHIAYDDYNAYIEVRRRLSIYIRPACERLFEESRIAIRAALAEQSFNHASDFKRTDAIEHLLSPEFEQFHDTIEGTLRGLIWEDV